jgi:AcrR family transcriptional regulator
MPQSQSAIALPSRPRRSQAERVETMRRRLLDAATEVLKVKGLAAFRTADVVTQAEVSKGALIHHFPTKDALIVAVFEQLYADAEAARDQAPSADGLPSALAELIADSHSFFFGESFEVSLNITVGAACDPELRDAIFSVVRRYRTAAEEMWVARLASLGVSRARALEAVWMINSMIRGLAVRALWEPDQARFAALERQLAQMVLENLSQSV